MCLLDSIINLENQGFLELAIPNTFFESLRIHTNDSVSFIQRGGLKEIVVRFQNEGELLIIVLPGNKCLFWAEGINSEFFVTQRCEKVEGGDINYRYLISHSDLSKGNLNPTTISLGDSESE